MALSFSDQLSEARRRAQLQGRPLSSQEISAMTTGWANTASERLARSKALQLQDTGQQLENTRFLDRLELDKSNSALAQKNFEEQLAFQKNQDEAQRRLAESAGERDDRGQIIQGLGTAAMVYGAGKQAGYWGGGSSPSTLPANQPAYQQIDGGEGGRYVAQETAPTATQEATSTTAQEVAPTLASDAAPMAAAEGASLVGQTAGEGASLYASQPLTAGSLYGSGLGAIIMAALRYGTPFLTSIMGGQPPPSIDSLRLAMLKKPELFRNEEESRSLWSGNNAYDFLKDNPSEVRQFQQEAIDKDKAAYNLVHDLSRSGNLTAFGRSSNATAYGITQEQIDATNKRFQNVWA